MTTTTTTCTCAAHTVCKDCIDDKHGPSHARDLLAKLARTRGELTTVPSPHRAGVTTVRTTIPTAHTTIPTARTTVGNPPTEKQVKYLRSLIDERDDTDAVRAVLNGHREAGTLTRQVVSTAIDTLLNLPRKQRETRTTEPVTEGIYLDPDGGLYKVQVAAYGTGNLYGKRFHKYDQPDEKGKAGEFVYEAGLLRKLHPEWLLSLEEAQKYGKLYGFCCVCGRVLTNEKSIEAGIGPVCQTRF